MQSRTWRCLSEIIEVENPRRSFTRGLSARIDVDPRIPVTYIPNITNTLNIPTRVETLSHMIHLQGQRNLLKGKKKKKENM